MQDKFFISLNHNVNRPKLIMNNNNGTCYLNNSFRVPAEDCPEQKILTYKLKVDYVFGDDALYGFVTYWDVPKKYLPDNSKFAKWYLIEFDGIEIIPETAEDESRNYSATIILK